MRKSLLRDLCIVLAGISILSSTMFLFPALPKIQLAHAQLTNPLGVQPFGGRILDTQTCNCPLGAGLATFGSKWIEVGDPRGGQFIYLQGLSSFVGLGSKLYEYKELDEGNWVLGLAAGPPLQCQYIGFCFGCCSKFGKRISIVGTSAEP
jgi:hypothetical protein